MKYVCVFFCLALIYGCNYKVIRQGDTKMILPKDESFTLAKDSNLTQKEDTYFQDLFPSPELKNLITTGLQKNPDWRVQLAKLEFEKVSSGLEFVESKPNVETRLGWMEGKEKTRESDFQKRRVPNLQAGALFNWELDLWGKWKLIKESSLMHIKEAEYVKSMAKISFIHEIAEMWILMTAKQKQIHFLNKAVSSQAKTMQMYKILQDKGLDDNETYISQGAANDQLKLEQTRIAGELEFYKIRLRSLLGQPLDRDISQNTDFSKIELPVLPKIFPTIALENRPDIKAKEAKLRESIYLEKSSAYDLYPSLAFQVSGISLASDISKTFDQWKAAFGPIFNFPIWSPKKKMLLDVAKAKRELKKEEWKAAVFKAIEEIEWSTISFIMKKEEYLHAQNFSKKTDQILQITKGKFRAGLISELVLLEGERNSLDAKIKSIESKMKVFQSAINLSRALGLCVEEI